MDSAARDLFVSEARELLANMEHALLALETEGSAEVVNAAFRAAHTIKGAAGLFDLELITSFTQVLESVLERVHKGALRVDPEFVSTLLQSCDYLGLLVAAIAERTEAVDPEPALRDSLLRRLGALAGASTEPDLSVVGLARAARPSATDPTGHWHVSLRFAPTILKDGMDPLAFITYLRSLGTLLYVITLPDELPSAEAMDPELCYLGFEIGVRTSADRATLERAFDFVRDGSDVRVLAPGSRVAEYIQIIQRLPAAGRRLGELLVASGAIHQGDLAGALATQAALREGAAAPRLGEVLVAEKLVAAPVVAAALDRQKRTDERRSTEQRIVRLDATKLDQLINLVGELVIANEGARTMAARDRNAPLLEAMSRVGQIVEQVRDRALDMRMIPIGEVFQRFPRVVRDVSKELGKDIELTITGAESELDKSMVDKLFDPLLHLVRNAIDHGIESTAERIEAGKRPQGRLRLHAFHDSGCIVVDVKDDGRGLHRDKIRSLAVERHLIPEDAQLSDDDVYRLLFLPGFSTASEVTDLSGRGVGMDVVKRSVEQLRGEIDIATRAQQGTRFRLRLPLTLAIIDGFQVTIDDTIFVIPLESVVECVSMSEAARTTQNLLSLRGDPLPYVRLREVFRLEPFPGSRESLVVVTHGAQRVGLVVDRLLGPAQAVIKPLGQLFRGSKAVSSSTILGDGSVGLILDVPTLVARASESAAHGARPHAVAHG